MSESHGSPVEDIHPFSRIIAEAMTDWIEGCINDHIIYPEDGLDDDSYMAQRKYALDEVEFEETDVAVHDNGKSKLNGLPELLSGVLTCNESKSGQRIGTVSIKMQFSYNLDKKVITPTE